MDGRDPADDRVSSHVRAVPTLDRSATLAQARSALDEAGQDPPPPFLVLTTDGGVVDAVVTRDTVDLAPPTVRPSHRRGDLEHDWTVVTTPDGRLVGIVSRGR
jgi:CBS domain-containing protein